LCPSAFPSLPFPSVSLPGPIADGLQASFAIRERDFERAYLMLYRESTIITQKLRTHPEFKVPESRKLYKTLSLDLPQVIQELEKLKPIIQTQFDEWQRMRPSSKDGLAQPSPSGWQPPGHINTRMIDPSENLELTVDIAESELRRRDASKRSTWLVPLDLEEQAGARPQPMASDDGLHSRIDATRRTFGSTRSERDVDDLQAQMESARRTLDSAGSGRPTSNRVGSGSVRTHIPSGTGSSYHYPATARSQPVAYVPQRSPHNEPPLRPELPPKEERSAPAKIALLPPIRPDKTPPTDGNGLYGYQVLPRPRKESLDWEWQDQALSDGPVQTQDTPARPPKEAIVAPPGRAKEAAKETPTEPKFQFKPAVRLENGKAIRYVFLPSSLRREFLKIAEPNTKRGIEMCGMLCGSVINGALFVTCLLIPEQNCTSDTCETVNESAMLDYCINEDLLIIGWIHTHPTQTCFMSSRDLHTQAGYQVMMPESIAIVCAPKFEPS
jgi:STAM-binding protein